MWNAPGTGQGLVSYVECDMDRLAMWNEAWTGQLCGMWYGLVGYVECNRDWLAMWSVTWTGQLSGM